MATKLISILQLVATLIDHESSMTVQHIVLSTALIDSASITDIIMMALVYSERVHVRMSRVPGSKVGKFSVEIFNEVGDGVVSRFTSSTVIQRRLEQVHDHCFMVQLPTHNTL